MTIKCNAALIETFSSSFNYYIRSNHSQRFVLEVKTIFCLTDSGYQMSYVWTRLVLISKGRSTEALMVILMKKANLCKDLKQRYRSELTVRQSFTF